MVAISTLNIHHSWRWSFVKNHCWRTSYRRDCVPNHLSIPVAYFTHPEIGVGYT
ncbi:hypothetical protein MKW98_010108, partial [Papaver atlanticum]